MLRNNLKSLNILCKRSIIYSKTRPDSGKMTLYIPRDLLTKTVGYCNIWFMSRIARVVCLEGMFFLKLMGNNFGLGKNWSNTQGELVPIPGYPVVFHVLNHMS